MKARAKTVKKGRTKQADEALVQSFLDMIAPSTIKFETDHFLCGNTFRCVGAAGMNAIICASRPRFISGNCSAWQAEDSPADS